MALRASVVEHLRNGGLHPCHANQKRWCAGYLRFAQNTLPHGVYSLGLARIMERIGALDVADIPELPVFASVKAMLAEHGRRMKRIALINRIVAKRTQNTV